MDPVRLFAQARRISQVFEMVAASATYANKGNPIYKPRLPITHAPGTRNGKVPEGYSFLKTDEVLKRGKKRTPRYNHRCAACAITENGSRLRLGRNNLQPDCGKTGTTQNIRWLVYWINAWGGGGARVGGEDRSIHFNWMEQGQGAAVPARLSGAFSILIRYAQTTKRLKCKQRRFSTAQRYGPRLEIDCSKYDADMDVLRTTAAFGAP